MTNLPSLTTRPAAPVGTPPASPPPYGEAAPKPPAQKWRPIGEVLVEAGAITRDDLLHALQEQQRTGKRLGEVLIEAGRISWLALAQAMGEQSGGPTPSAPVPAPAPSVATVVDSHDPIDKLEAVEALLRERQRAFIELVSTTERLRRQVSELEGRLSERNAELAQLKRASLGIG